MLWQRVVTAMILIPLILFLLFFLSPRAFCIFTMLIAFWAAWEWSHLMEIRNILGRLIYLFFVGSVFFMVLFISTPFIFLCAFVWWSFATLFIIFYPRGSGWWQKSIVFRGLMGLFVLTPCWVAINFIRNMNQNRGIYTLIFLLVLIWGADSAAYFVGKKWGKTKLAPHISPGKSLQGLYGALIATLLITLGSLWLFNVPPLMWPGTILLCFITVLFSVIGDLFESMLKRQARLKDSGHLLPGHGGLLDRIDSLTAAAPIFAWGMMLLR